MKLSVDNFSMRTKARTLVKNISFTVVDHQSIAIIGPSGSGKTTLLKGLLGLKNDHAALACEGRIAFSKSDLRFGYVPQELSLWPHLTVAHTLKLAHQFAQKRSTPREINHLIDICGLTHLTKTLPRSLSGGEKQRLALARALINAPHFLILDEPFAHLDVVARAELLKLIATLKSAAPFNLIFVSHDLAESTALCDLILVMDKGEQIWLGESKALSRESFLPHWNPLT